MRYVLILLTPFLLTAQDLVTQLKDFGAPASLLQQPEALKGEFTVAEKAPTVQFAILPNQWEGARLWSSWGDALYASDGCFYASIGDHGGPRGTSYVYKIDPQTGEVRLVVDYNEVVGIEADNYAPGKIHAPICEGDEGWLYIVGYYGSVSYTTAESQYAGDWLIRYQPATGRTENLGIMVPHYSLPTMRYVPQQQLLVGLAMAGKTQPDGPTKFVAYDLAKRQLVADGGPSSSLNRTLIVTRDGRVYYDADGVLVRYTPKTGKIEKTTARIPGDGTLRAASKPAPDGRHYCFSKDGIIFIFNPEDETIEEIGTALETRRPYTTTCKLSPDGRYLYYVPSAHGGSHEHGTAVMRLDTQTHAREVIAFMNALIRDKEQLNLGGTYGIAVNGDGSQLFINWNGGPVDQKRNDFGVCAVSILQLPQP